jgi:hypothetical protein
MEIRIERADDVSVDASKRQYLLIGRGAETAVEHMHCVPTVRTEQLDGGAGKPLVEQDSNHAVSSRSI